MLLQQDQSPHLCLTCCETYSYANVVRCVWYRDKLLALTIDVWSYLLLPPPSLIVVDRLLSVCNPLHSVINSFLFDHCKDWKLLLRICFQHPSASFCHSSHGMYFFFSCNCSQKIATVINAIFWPLKNVDCSFFLDPPLMEIFVLNALNPYLVNCHIF